MKKYIENVIFGSKWLLIPFYLGLMAVLGIYTFVYIKEIIHLFSNINTITKETVMVAILEIVDIVMIASLVKMIITGGYNSSVTKDHGHEDSNVSSGILKVKMSTALIGVTSIHLLQTFINATNSDWDTIYKQLAIHITLLIGALILAIIEFLHEKGSSNAH